MCDHTTLEQHEEGKKSENILKQSTGYITRFNVIFYICSANCRGWKRLLLKQRILLKIECLLFLNFKLFFP